MVQGMLAARPRPGRRQLRAAAIGEEMAALTSVRERMMASRALIGPKGGLPTFKGDLLKLAALLHVKVDDKATIKDLRTKLGPAAADVCGKIGYAKAVEHVASKTSGSSSVNPSGTSSAGMAPTSTATPCPNVLAAPGPVGASGASGASLHTDRCTQIRICVYRYTRI